MIANSFLRSFIGMVIPRGVCMAALQDNGLQHGNLGRRVLVSVGLGQLVMFSAWSLAFLFLPEGILRGRTGAAILTSATEGMAGLFTQALAWNGAVAFVVIPLLGVLAVRRLSLAHVLALGNFALFGVFMGTNSFGVPMSGPAAPEFGVYLGTGPWEISAYCIMAAVVADRFRFNQVGWIEGRVERNQDRNKEWSVGHTLATAGAILIIFATAWVESS